MVLQIIPRRKIKMNQKEIAVQCLKKLGVYGPYIRKFEKEDMPTFFERFAGYYLFNDLVLQDKVKKVQEANDVLVYALTHEWLEFGECWSMLCVTRNTQSIDECITDTLHPDTFYVNSYVWNLDNEHFSEFGDVVINTSRGRIRRLG
jgi:hypothetical protein